MRTLCFVAVLAALCSGFSSLKASEGFEELSNRAKAGATEDELNAFVQRSNVPYDLTVDEIFALNDLGYSSKTIAAIIEHGKAVQAGKVPPAAEVAIPATPTPAPDNGNPPAAALKIDTPNTLPPQPQPNVPTVPNQPDPNKTTLVNSEGETLRIEETVNAPLATGDVVAPPEGDANVGMFYTSLAPYGSWVRLNGGWYWRPTACLTDANWRPYCDRGHWVWTDSDWCWQSDYSWGWAPFHYGRWSHCDGYGWVWMPDTVWSPAWVSWRECDSHYGWAPLPWSARYEVGVGFHFGGRHGGVDFGFGLGYRDYFFCPCDHFCDASLRVNILFGRDHENIYNRTTIIQNNVTVVNNHVVVNGPRFDHVQQRTGTQIKQLHLADANIHAGDKLTRASHEDRRNGTIQMYRPAIKETATVTPASFAAKHVPNAVSGIHENNIPHTANRVVEQPNTLRNKFGTNETMTNHHIVNETVPNTITKTVPLREKPIVRGETGVVTQPKTVEPAIVHNPETVTHPKTYETPRTATPRTTYEVPSHTVTQQPAQPSPTARANGYSSSNYNSGNTYNPKDTGRDKNNR